ncbi:MAG: hypothetical protein KF884_05115 [Fimbriimonadaceae bacterium]|nr:hypothetical protein [Fimbriimonadaceae bacterium]QYK59465.1 MAG: hypothetical protein KF884_05115 [Fimbriimonadaceae bacterium]
MTALFALLIVGQATKPISVEALAKDQAKFDGKQVTVDGSVKKYQARVSKKDNKYATFVVLSGKSEVNVYLRAHVVPALKDGDKVRVSGTYRRVKKVGTRTFQNEIEAQVAAGKPVGVKRLTGQK